MAKDAKGHGSEKRGGSAPSASKVASDALALRPQGPAYWSPGMSRAHQTPVQQENAPFKSSLPGPHYLDPHDPRGLVTDKQAASTLAQGGAKSAAVPVHPGASGRSQSFEGIQAALKSGFDRTEVNDQGHKWGSPEAIKDFTDTYGKPLSQTAARQRNARIERFKAAIGKK